VNKNKIFVILAVLIGFLLTFGCMQLEVNLNVKEDGKSNASMVMDMSGIKTLYSSMGSMIPEEQMQQQLAELDANYSKENICNTLRSQQTESQENTVPGITNFDMETAECTGLANYKAMFSFEEVDLVENGTLIIEDNFLTKKYILTIPSSENESEEMDASQITMMKSMGGSMVMNIEMPGEIKEVSPELGEIIDNKKLRIDLIEDMSKLQKNDVVIVSEMSNSQILIIGGAILVVLILAVGVGLFVMKKKQPKQPVFANKPQSDFNNTPPNFNKPQSDFGNTQTEV
jgi:hypothetical protein